VYEVSKKKKTKKKKKKKRLQKSDHMCRFLLTACIFFPLVLSFKVTTIIFIYFFDPKSAQKSQQSVHKCATYDRLGQSFSHSYFLGQIGVTVAKNIRIMMNSIKLII
jgi:hypothetical protein